MENPQVEVVIVQLGETQPKRVFTKEETDAYKRRKFERYREANKLAVEEILKGSDDKLFYGGEKVELYKFHYMIDQNAKEDTNGNKIVFGDNVRMLDMVLSNDKFLFKMLERRLNKNKKSGEEKYHCGYYKNKREDSNIVDWYIYASTKTREEIQKDLKRQKREEEIKKNNENQKNENINQKNEKKQNQNQNQNKNQNQIQNLNNNQKQNQNQKNKNQNEKKENNNQNQKNGNKKNEKENRNNNKKEIKNMIIPSTTPSWASRVKATLNK